jgi:hypothetical protein
MEVYAAGGWRESEFVILGEICSPAYAEKFDKSRCT